MASDLMNTSATGKYYKVQPNGKAQSGLKEGDRVVTNGGTYQILKVKADGSYESALYDSGITTKNYSGKYADNSPYSKAESISAETKSSIRDEYDRDYSSGITKRESPERPEYVSAYKKQIDKLLDRLENREAFSYDLNSDALYQQYRQSYMNAGKQAMEDVSGQAASLTGGYGNTYAASASSAAYESYIQKLNDRIPELYSNARQNYEAEGDELYRLYSLYVGAERSDYEKYRDSVEDWQADRAYSYNEYIDEKDRAQKDYYSRLAVLQDAAKLESGDYWKAAEQKNTEWSQSFKQEQFDYSKEQDKVKSSSSSVSKKGKNVTTALYDEALEAYSKGGEASLMRLAEKLTGSGYDASGINDLLSYARKYGKARDSKTGSSGFNSVLVDLFNYRG